MPRAKKEELKKEVKSSKFFEARGARKTAVARVRLVPGHGKIIINNKDYKSYFRNPNHQEIIVAPLAVEKIDGKFDITVKVRGGGLTGQAEAVRHGLAHVFVKYSADLRKKFRKLGFLTRDSRMVERKKYGLKKARRAPQWSKR